MPIVRERITTAVRYARKRDIRHRHSLSIGACGRSCSVDKHLKARKEPGWNDVSRKVVWPCGHCMATACGRAVVLLGPRTARNSPRASSTSPGRIVTQHTPT